MTSIAIVAPDRNRVIGLSANLPISVLRTTRYDDPRVTRIPSVDTVTGDWPFMFDRIYVPERKRWRGYAPDDLPMEYWYL